MALRIVIIASGAAYQQAASLSAPTFLKNTDPQTEVSVWVPFGEDICKDLIESKSTHKFSLGRFPLKLVSESKYTSQLKCQGYLFALSELPQDGLTVFVDADTCCLAKLSIPAEVEDSIYGGSIGMVADIVDRHFKSPNDPWFLREDERLTYVNSGVILASSKSLPMFRRFRSLSARSEFLHGPFNDQKVINFAMGKYFQERLVVLERAYNSIGPPFAPGAMIGHFAGGAGYLGQQHRKALHAKFCENTLRSDSGEFPIVVSGIPRQPVSVLNPFNQAGQPNC